MVVRLPPAVIVLALGGVAHAAPLATLAADVDGDGAPDAIELGADGVVRITGTPRGEVKLAPAITHGALAVGRYRGQRYIVAQLARPSAPGTPATTEAVILRVDAGSWHEVVRVAVGGVGLDQDYGVAIDATDDGIYRYQTRGDIRRCDGKPAYLFADKLDGAKFRRASALPSGVAASAAVLRATRDAGAAAPPVVYQAHAASHEPGVSDAGGLAIPRELDDGRLDTLWREELAASAGEGQFFTFEPRAAGARAAQLRIVPGNPASAQAMRGVNRPRTIAIVAGGADGLGASGAPPGAAGPAAGGPGTNHVDAWRVELPDAAGEPLGTAFVVDLPRPVAGCVTVILESTYGAPKGTTAIAELEVFAEGERQGGGEAVLARAVADGGAGSVTAAAALGKRGAAGAVAIEAALAATTDRGARQRLIGALAAIGDPAAAPVLVHAATTGWVRDQDLLDVIGALGKLGQPPALRDLAAQGALPIAARVAAAQRIAPDAAGLPLLVGLAGRGPGELRRAVTDQLAGAPLDALVAAIAAAQAAPVAGDLWHAVTRSVHAAPARRGAALAAMQAALPAAADYERRYRLVDGIAALGDPAALDMLAAWLAALPDAGTARGDGTAAALRQVAIAAIAGDPRPDARPFVIARAGDRDPGVRLAAIAALAPDGGDPDTDRVIGDRVAHDAWPEVRRQAAVALGSRCQRPEPARALVAAVAHDPEVVVRGDALAALVACHAAGTAALLARIWSDDQAPLALRSRAVLEAVALGDPATGAALVARLPRWRGEALSNGDALALAQAAAASIGRLAPPGAARALTDALDDSAFPEMIQAAALGLAALGPACPADARARLAQIAQTDSQAAVAAKRAAAQCGQ